MNAADSSVPQLGMRQYQLLYEALLGDIGELLTRLEQLRNNAPDQDVMLKMLGEMHCLAEGTSGQIEQLSKLSQTLSLTLGALDQQNQDFISIHQTTLDAMNSQLRALGQHEQRILLGELQQQLNNGIIEHLKKTRSHYGIMALLAVLSFVCGNIVGKFF